MKNMESLSLNTTTKAGEQPVTIINVSRSDIQWGVVRGPWLFTLTTLPIWFLVQFIAIFK
jgi:hypothetical protein